IVCCSDADRMEVRADALAVDGTTRVGRDSDFDSDFLSGLANPHALSKYSISGNGTSRRSRNLCAFPHDPISLSREVAATKARSRLVLSLSDFIFHSPLGGGANCESDVPRRTDTLFALCPLNCSRFRNSASKTKGYRDADA